MHLLTDKYLSEYQDHLKDFEINFECFLASSLSLDFSYITEASSVYSSNIEGNTLDLNSFMNARMKWQKPKDAEEIDDLIEAYTYAQDTSLGEKNFLKTHSLASKSLLPLSLRGKYRNDTVRVFGDTGLIYLALEAKHVPGKMSELFVDINYLLGESLDPLETFYFASLIHLVFVHIHPFPDGNGRSARLLEKWFITSKLGDEFWKLSSEKYYKEHRWDYYQNLNLWVNYYELDYRKCLPFLNMLPKSLRA